MSIVPPKPSPPDESYALDNLHPDLGGLDIPLSSKLPHQNNPHFDGIADLRTAGLDPYESEDNDVESDEIEDEDSTIPRHQNTPDFAVSILNNRSIPASVVVPILKSRIWLLVIAIACLIMGFLWIKEATDALRFQSGIMSRILHFAKLVGAYFLFVHPAYKLWLLKREIGTLQNEPDEDSVGLVLYHQAKFWKYLGLVIISFVAFSIGSALLTRLTHFLSL